MTTANDIQFGGDHYKTGSVQHWDVIDDYGYPYLEGCATKYILRHRKKNGLEDLKKARHFMVKIRENIEREGNRSWVAENLAPDEVINALCEASDCGTIERSLCLALLGQLDLTQIDLALQLIGELILNCYSAA